MSINRLNVHAFFTSFDKALSHPISKSVYSITLIPGVCVTGSLDKKMHVSTSSKLGIFTKLISR